MRVRRQRAKLLVSLATVMVLIVLAPLMAQAQSVARPSQDQIISFYNGHPYDEDHAVTYASEPSVAAPYKEGRLSDAAMQEGLNYVNLVRYVAGVPAGVTLSEEYIGYAQAGALVNAANNVMAHEPKKPAGMSDQLYQKGYKGTSSGNLSYSSSTSFNPVQSVRLYLSDDDASNVGRVGHRRWVLNPNMTQTGFGQARSANGASHGCMYVISGAYNTDYSGIAWPARNMPVQLFASNDPWSYSLPAEYIGADPRVKLTRKSDGRTWYFSTSQSDGEFYVSATNGYGRLGCLIFRPSGIGTYVPGDEYTVQITGTRADETYTVSFFNMTSEPCVSLDLAKVSISQNAVTYDGSAKTQTVSVTINGRSLAEGTDYTVAYANNVNAGNARVTVSGKGDYYGENSSLFTISPRDIASAHITAISEQLYTGKALEPAPNVSANGATLRNGTDYTCSYANNINAGTATVTITGKGNYTGTKSATFTIKRPNYTVTFNAQGGTSTASQTVALLNKASKPSDPSRSGYIFKGWYTSASGDAPFDFNTAITGNTTVYAQWAQTQVMHRLYNKWTGEHFYTADTSERDSLVKVGWTYEGAGWVAPVKWGTPVYRLYNRYVPGGDHHYTTDVEERDVLVRAGWTSEGVGWYSGGSVPVYRQYNPFAVTGTHNYTADKHENDELVKLGWKEEGIGWYAVSAE